MTLTHLLWVAKKYGKNFLKVFCEELNKKGFSSEKNKVEDIISDIVLDKNNSKEDIEESFNNAKARLNINYF